MKRFKLSLLAGAVLLGFVGCGTDDSSNDSGIKGVLVDPYIVGATLCEDVNKNGTCEEDEQVSSKTNSSGVFSFSEELTAGSNVIIKTQGLHDGKEFDLNLSAKVASDGSIDVVSPLTTLSSKNLTASQVVGILSKAASDAGVSSSYSFDETTIFNDPLAGNLMNKSISSISDATLTNIRASLATYGILKIMEGSDTLKALSGTELYTNGTTTGSEVNLIAQEMLKYIANSLNTSLLSDIKTQVDAGRTALETGLANGLKNTPLNGTATSKATAAMPDVTIGLVIKVATKIIDDVAQTGYTTCNNTSGTSAQKVTAALSAVTTRAALVTTSSKITQLGTTLYAYTNKSTIVDELSGYYSAGLSGLKSANSYIKNGLEASSSAKTFYFDTNANVVEYIPQ